MLSFLRLIRKVSLFTNMYTSSLFYLMIDLLDHFIQKAHHTTAFPIRDNMIKIMPVHDMMPLAGKFQLAFNVQIMLNSPEKPSEKPGPWSQAVPVLRETQIGFHEGKEPLICSANKSAVAAEFVSNLRKRFISISLLYIKYDASEIKELVRRLYRSNEYTQAKLKANCACKISLFHSSLLLSPVMGPVPPFQRLSVHL